MEKCHNALTKQNQSENMEANDLILFSEVYISEFEMKLTLLNSKKVKSKMQGQPCLQPFN